MSPVAKTNERGYGWKHQNLRQSWQRVMAERVVLCSRCERPILPGQPWDLGHDDHDRSRYTGPEHRVCNRATAGRRKPLRSSRAW
jgi:hypothetical protein